MQVLTSNKMHVICIYEVVQIELKKKIKNLIFVKCVSTRTCCSAVLACSLDASLRMFSDQV